jgi:small subunit ribosomal protein S3
MWTINTVMGAGAMGVEITIAGKLRSERAHFEKHSSGVIPKSGNAADKIVKLGITDVLTKMGLMGIQLRIALKNEVPPDFELIEAKQETSSNSNLQSDQDSEREDINNTEQENSTKKISLESNNQNMKRPQQQQQQQQQIRKSKDIKDKSMNPNKVKEKGSVLVKSK